MMNQAVKFWPIVILVILKSVNGSGFINGTYRTPKIKIQHTWNVILQNIPQHTRSQWFGFYYVAVLDILSMNNDLNCDWRTHKVGFYNEIQ